MEIRTSEEARQNIEAFTAEYLEMMLEKKKLDAEIKELKDRYKEDGVPVGIVCGVLNKIKKNKKMTDSAKFEQDTIQEWLESNQTIDDTIGILLAK